MSYSGLNYSRKLRCRVCRRDMTPAYLCSTDHSIPHVLCAARRPDLEHTQLSAKLRRDTTLLTAGEMHSLMREETYMALLLRCEDRKNPMPTFGIDLLRLGTRASQVLMTTQTCDKHGNTNIFEDERHGERIKGTRPVTFIGKPSPCHPLSNLIWSLAPNQYTPQCRFRFWALTMTS